MSDEHTNSNARDAALGSLPPELREALLRKASDLGVHRADDVVWALVASVIDAAAAAQVAGQHVKTLVAETGKVPDLIYQGTMRASNDLKEGVAQAIEDKTVEAGQALVGAIAHAAGKGAADLQKAAAGLDRMGAEKATAFVEQWKVHLAHAIKEQAKASLAWKLAEGWGVVATLLSGIFVLGMLVMAGIGILNHRVILSSTVTYHRAAVGDPPQINFVGPLYRAASCPPRETCLVVPSSGD
ncbi:MAG: hypothetical protein M0Z68_08400 [Gammaproteobacteria bacterium]|nr:hypothetical protein [Gammaproteobacteria bacterium]